MNKNHTVTLKSNPENLTKQPLDEILRLGAQELLAQALDVEVNLHLERYQYMIDEQMRRLVVRNGYHEARKIVTGAGPVEVRVPRVDDRELQDEPRFISRLVPPYLRKTKNMEELLPVLYLKGISTGDFGEALENILGKNAVGLSAQTICRLKEIWQKEYEAWAKRDLSSVEYVYWWADGIHFNVRLGDDKRMCILVIVGARRDGIKEIVAVVDGFRESKEHWASVLRDLKRRGLKQGPKLAVGDGALGLWAAMAEEFMDTNHQLCWVHKICNVLDKLPDSLQAKAKDMLENIQIAPTKMDANVAFDVFIEEFEHKYPSVVRPNSDSRPSLNLGILPLNPPGILEVTGPRNAEAFNQIGSRCQRRRTVPRRLPSAGDHRRQPANATGQSQRCHRRHQQL